MTRNSRARPVRPFNNEFGYSKGIEILPGVPNVRFVPVNTGNPRNLRSVSKLIFDPSLSQVIFSVEQN